MSSTPPPDSYDWVFQDGTPARPAAPAPSAAPGQLPSAPPTMVQPVVPPTPAPAPKRRRRGGWLWVVALLLAGCLGFLVGVPVMAWSAVTKVDATPDGKRPSAGKATTYLLVGTDKRQGETARGRTDTIMLLTFGGSGPSVLTSIPRDSQVDIPGRGRNKINASYSWGGAPLLVETLEDATGVRIDGYVEIGFHGLVDVVDALGGITLCPKEDLQDEDSHLDILAGCQTVDGKTALAYSRNRHSYATGDIQRGQSQREVIGAIGDAILSPRTILDPVRYAQVVNSTAASVSVGENVSMFGAGSFAWTLSRAMAGSGLNCTVPIRDMAVNWDADRSEAFFEHLRAGTTGKLGKLCTKDGLPA